MDKELNEHDEMETEFTEMVTSKNIRQSNTNCSWNVQSPLVWEATFTDKLLFPLTAAVFLALLILLTAVNISRQDSPTYQAECWCPAQFTHEWVQYADNFCNSELANLTLLDVHADIEEISEEEIKARMVHRSELFSPVSDSLLMINSDTVSTILLMTVLSIVPPTAWYLVKGFDGYALQTLQFRRKRWNQFCAAGLVTSAWYLICQWIMVLMSVIMYLYLTGYLKVLSHPDNQISQPNWKQAGRVDKVVVLCDFWVRVLGGKLNKFTVQCVITRIIPATELTVLKAGEYWTLYLMIATTINGLIVSLLALLAFAKSTILAWYLGSEICPSFCSMVGWPDLFVSLLASRRGETGRVVEILSDAHKRSNQA